MATPLVLNITWCFLCLVRSRKLPSLRVGVFHCVNYPATLAYVVSQERFGSGWEDLRKWMHGQSVSDLLRRSVGTLVSMWFIRQWPRSS
jgi:hypothetical protein